MKLFSILSLAAALTVAGCATQKRVSQMQGHGTTQVYAASFDPAWRAAVDAAQHDSLEIVTADRTTGYISARRTLRPHTFGENVGIWMRELTPGRTQVEVVSRQSGPPVAWLKNWENEIQRSIAANLTREIGVGAPPRDVIIDRGRGSTTIVVPERRETVIVPETSTTVSESERQRREVERLREELRLQEERLRDLERDVK